MHYSVILFYDIIFFADKIFRTISWTGSSIPYPRANENEFAINYFHYLIFNCAFNASASRRHLWPLSILFTEFRISFDRETNGIVGNDIWFRYSPLDPIFSVPDYFPRCHCWCWPLQGANVPVRREPMLDCPISMAFDLAVLNSFRMSPTFLCSQFPIFRRKMFPFSIAFRMFLTQLDWAQTYKSVNGVVMKSINFNCTNRLPVFAFRCNRITGNNSRRALVPFSLNCCNRWKSFTFANTQINTCALINPHNRARNFLSA